MVKIVTQANKTIKASVIQWEARERTWGVAIDLLNGGSADYEVGSKAGAIIECRRLEDGKPPLWGPWAGLNLIESH
jgi:hypothetical protein